MSELVSQRTRGKQCAANERGAPPAKRPRRLSAQSAGTHFAEVLAAEEKLAHTTLTVALDDGDEVQLNAAWTSAFLQAGLVQADRCRQRFVERCKPAALAGLKSYFFRETDRHSIFYVRARREMLWRMRGKSGTPPVAHDFGTLSDEEAQAVVCSAFTFRLVNRLASFVRFAVLSRRVDKERETDKRAWQQAYDELERATDAVAVRERDAIRRSWKKARSLPDGVPAAAVPVTDAVVTPARLRAFFAFMAAMMDEEWLTARRRALKPAKPFERPAATVDHLKVFTGEHITQGLRKTECVLRTLLHGLPALTRALRGASSMDACCKLIGREHVRHFFQYQILLDLIEPRHSIFRGQPNEAPPRPPQRTRPWHAVSTYLRIPVGRGAVVWYGMVLGDPRMSAHRRRSTATGSTSRSSAPARAPAPPSLQASRHSRVHPRH